jgi:hypothetical protein
MRMPFEPDILRVPSMSAPPVTTFEQPLPAPSQPIEEISWAAPTPIVPTSKVSEILPPVEQIPPIPEMQTSVEIPTFSDIAPAVEISPAAEIPLGAEISSPVEPAHASEPVVLNEPIPATTLESVPDFELDLPIEANPEVEAEAAVEPVESAPVFNLDSLPPEEQELHRRAFRVAKVSMQDIRMLRPEDVRLGRQNRDLCYRLRDDIEKAHKEYDRRFQSIQSHPVDYFYDWMVEILAGGDPQALGEYPYPSPVLRR